MMFGSGVGSSGSADLIVQLSNFKNPRFRLTAIFDIQKWPQLRNRFTDRRDIRFYIGRGFRLSLDFFLRDLHTRTAVARNPCISQVFL